MRRQSETRLPLLRLVIYLVVFGICASVSARELYYSLACHKTSATVLAVGKTSVSARSASYWADYEYFDAQQVRQVGRAEPVHPATSPGDRVDVQYFRHAPTTSRLAPSPAGGLCFGSVALLAVIVFVAEIVTRRQRRRRARRRVDLEPD